MDLEASVGVQVGAWGAGASGSFSAVSRAGTTQSNRKVIFHFQANGGDTSKVTDPEAWTASTGEFKNWVIIGVESVIPTIDLLSQDLRVDIHKIFAPLRGRWARFGKSELDEFMLRNSEWGWVTVGGTNPLDERPLYLFVKGSEPDSLSDKVARDEIVFLTNGPPDRATVFWPLAGYEFLGAIPYLRHQDGRCMVVKRNLISRVSPTQETKYRLLKVPIPTSCVDTKHYTVLSGTWRSGLWALHKDAIYIENEQEFKFELLTITCMDTETESTPVVD